MKENKKTQQKYERYEDTIMIMRQLFGTRLTSRPGYILLQDVIYKHLKENGKIIRKVANEELPKDENPEEKIKEIIKVSFDSEEGLLDFLKTI